MRILHVIFLLSALVSPLLAIRFLFASDISCDNDEVFEFRISYWNGEEIQIAPDRVLTARKNLFFFHEGSAESIIDPYGVHALIGHNCTKDGKRDQLKYYFKNVTNEKVVWRLDYAVNLSTDKSNHPDH